MIQTPALKLKHSEREYFVSKIRSGIYIVNFNGFKFKILQPTIEQEFEFNEVYAQAYVKAIDDGIKTEDEMVQLMIERGLWSAAEDDKIEQIKKDTDKLKKEIYNAKTNHHLKETLRVYLRTAESAMGKLREKRGAYFANTCEGIATSEKLYAFLMANTFLNGQPHDFKNGPSFDYLSSLYYGQILSEKIVRYLARTEPWRSFWLLNGSNTVDLFAKNGRELSIDQRNILVWSKMYDNVYESMETPPDFVVEDDDMLDGWFIVQKEKAEQRKTENEIDKINAKHANADEVFLMANSKEDIDRIHSMNSTHARMIKKQREKLIDQKGEVQQHEFADEKLRLGAMAKEQFKSNFRR